MKRREFVEKVGLGSAAAIVAGPAGETRAKTPGAPGAIRPGQETEHNHRPIKGSLATATVSFGQWRTDVPLDRYQVQLPIPPPPPGNGHLLIPHQVTIKVGGTVNYIIAGFHQVIVYAPGKRPEEVNTTLLRPTRGVTSAPVPLINDPDRRLYAGPDPSTILAAEQGTQPLLDRVEVVQFSRKGRHLVICGVLRHFAEDDMYGWVKVVGDEDDED